MKNKILKAVIVLLISLAPVLLLAQNPPHPNGGNGPTGTNTPVGGGAPIDGGLTIMLILGVAYGSKKIFQKNK